ncbi:IS30 family transposase [Mycoplasmopsis gallinacea]|uniref:IS30 family transposase n=1 Tax=Mycoplasmopsis gallinacea TaxID=29556 RepID=UPI001E2FEA56|nr:IS30 family transposase [Mycoplasmopsis gallinacea]
MNYKRICFKNRAQLELFLKDYSISLEKIAKILGFSKSTIWREIKNNSTENGYIAEEAENKSKIREKWKNQFKLESDFYYYKDFTKVFLENFDNTYSGVKITWFKIKNHYDFPIPTIKTIYNWMNSGLWALTIKNKLRPRYKKGGKRTGDTITRLVGNRYVIPITFRPKNVNDRSEFGHWEADLIVGKKGKSTAHLLTFEERQTRYGLIRKVPDKNPWNVAKVLFELIKEKRLNVKSITIDNGLEFKSFFMIGYRLQIKIYKADSYASFQKGSIENFNGLIRRKYPKKTNFSKISDEEIMETEKQINNMPREILDYFSADELFFDLNYYKKPWDSKIQEIQLYDRAFRKRKSNTERNKFFKWYKK